jgi:hypothetical protein
VDARSTQPTKPVNNKQYEWTMTYWKSVAAGFLLTALSAQQADAAGPTTCSFTLNAVSVDSTGVVSINATNSSGNWQWKLCNVNGGTSVTDGGTNPTISSDTCKAMLAHLTTTRAAGRPWSAYFIPIGDCGASLPATNGWLNNPFPQNMGF